MLCVWNFIRYDLPEDSRIGLITFNNQSSVLNRLTELSDETVRARLADSVPDIYKVTNQVSPSKGLV